MTRLLLAFLLLISTVSYSQGPLYTGDSTQRRIDRGQIGSRYGIVNAIKDTSAVPDARRTNGLVVYMSGVPYVWTGAKWLNGCLLASMLGQPNGAASLGPDGYVPFSELPFTEPLDFKGGWDASTNTPHLEDGIGTKGHMYVVSVSGTQNLGHGSIDYLEGDIIICDPDLVYLSIGRVAAPQVNSDWNAVSGVAMILNKPTTIAGYGITDAVPVGTQITINGVTYNLSANRTWNVGTVVASDLLAYTLKPSVNPQSGTTYTIQASDYGKVISFTNSSAVTVTMPSGFSSGFYCTIQQYGTGQVTLVAGSGVTIQNADLYTKTAKQKANFSIFPTGTSETYITQGQMQ